MTSASHDRPLASSAAAATWWLAGVAAIVALVRHGTIAPLALTVALALLGLPLLRRVMACPPRLSWRGHELLEGIEVTSADADAPGYREPGGGASIRIAVKTPRGEPAAVLFLSGLLVLLIDAIAAHEAFPGARIALGYLPAGLTLLFAYLVGAPVQTITVRPVDRTISGGRGEVLVPRGGSLGVCRAKAGKHVWQVIELVEPQARICTLNDRPRAAHVAELLARMIEDVSFAGAYRYEHALTGRAAEVIRIPLGRPEE